MGGAVPRMSIDSADVVVVGAGVVGLAVAASLASRGREVVVLERHRGFGFEASSRNSEVIHSGLYYRAGSLEAMTCVAGNKVLTRLVRGGHVRGRVCGKLIVATSPSDEVHLEELCKRGEENGLTDLVVVDADWIASKSESTIFGSAGLWIPQTGIVDSHGLMRLLERRLSSCGGVLSLQTEVAEIHREDEGVCVETKDRNGASFSLRSRQVVVAAGLQGLSLAQGMGVAPQGWRNAPLRGSYGVWSNAPAGLRRFLVYPLPEAASLGVHSIIDLGGRVRIGPTADIHAVSPRDGTDNVHVEARDLEVLVGAGQRLFPELKPGALQPDQAGWRARIVDERGDRVGFRVHYEAQCEVPPWIFLLGIESPGLTSAIALGEMVADLANTGILRQNADMDSVSRFG